MSKKYPFQAKYSFGVDLTAPVPNKYAGHLSLIGLNVYSSDFETKLEAIDKKDKIEDDFKKMASFRSKKLSNFLNYLGKFNTPVT